MYKNSVLYVLFLIVNPCASANVLHFCQFFIKKNKKLTVWRFALTNNVV